MNNIGAVITLKEISRLSGYSVSTVSKALNNKLDISVNTRKLIRNIAEENNYVPNNFAVALRKRTSKVIAIIVPQVNQEFFGCFLYTIQKTASSLGFRLLFFQSFNDYAKESEYLSSINDGSVAGAIVLSENVHNINGHNVIFPLEIVSVNHSTDEEKTKDYCIKRFNMLLNKV